MIPNRRSRSRSLRFAVTTPQNKHFIYPQTQCPKSVRSATKEAIMFRSAQWSQIQLGCQVTAVPLLAV